jgi:CRISPR-associated protein Csx10
MSIELKFRLTLHSDYHISAGHGLGDAIDSALQRDSDGLPVLRGTSVTGLLRDGLRRLADHPKLQPSLSPPAPSGTGRSPQMADRFFGAPHSPKRWMISSARPKEAVAPQQRSGLIGSHAAAHVRVDPATRRTEARKLFVREEGDHRWQFTFTATCETRDDNTLAEAALLVAAARMVQNLGAQRRRGRGQCTIDLESVEGWERDAATQNDQDALLALFRSHWLEGQPGPTLKSSLPELQPATTDQKPVRMLLLLRTDEPILIARRAAAGNEFEGLNYIAGTVIRGALATRIAQRHDLKKQAEVYEEFVRLFYRDGIQCTNCLPGFLKKGNTLVPAVPAPQDLLVSELHPRDQQLADSRFTLYDASMAATVDFKELGANDSFKLEPATGYLGVEKDLPLVKVRKNNEMHVTIEADTGRALDANLFGYVALAAGQYFLGEIVCANAATWENVRKLADLPLVTPPPIPDELGKSKPFQLRLGKAYRRGYGKVTGILLSSPPVAPWAGVDLAQRVKAVDTPLTLTLFSDAIVLDDWGRAEQEFNAQWLSRELGIEVGIVEVNGHELNFARSRVVDSFNNTHGLPRHRDLALTAGSAVTLRLVDPVPTLEQLQVKLRRLESTGIGLRRNEGFGRVLFNHPLYDNACAAAANNSILIPRELLLGGDMKKSVPADEHEWENKWNAELRNQRDKLIKFRYAEFAGLVRELGSVDSAQAATSLLADYGKPEKDNLFGEELRGRQKPNFFEQPEKGKAGLDLLQTLFAKLTQHAGASQDRWQRGCRILADQIAAEVALAEEKRS